MMARLNKANIFRVLASLCAMVIAPVYAQDAQPQASVGGAGDLQVAPTRVVLEGRTRASEIMLTNKGSKEATYRVSFTHLRMGPDGNYTEISEADAKASLKVADDLMRYSPRQVTLKPGETQVVKVMVRKPEGLADGEYISHLMFRAVPEDMATGEDVEASAQPQNGQISINLIPVYGVTIPVIVRQGELSAQVALAAQAAPGAVNITIARSGNKSVFGDLSVLKGNEVVGELRGIAVLAYSDKRNVSIPVTASGPLTVQYRERPEDGGKIIATTEIRS